MTGSASVARSISTIVSAVRIAFYCADLQQPAIGKRITAGLLAAHIQQKSIQPSGQRHLARGMIAAHQRLPGFREHACFGFHFLREELRADDGLGAPVFQYLFAHEFGVDRDILRHAFRIDHESPADAIHLLQLPGGAQLTRQQGLTGPRGAPEVKGEMVCIPALEDPSILTRLWESERQVLEQSAAGTLAKRYRE